MSVESPKATIAVTRAPIRAEVVTQADFAARFRLTRGGSGVPLAGADFIGTTRASLLEPVRTVISSCPPTALTYCSSTSRVTL